MEVFIIVSLILAGLLLFIVEVFLIPGISIAGIASAICLLYANYYDFRHIRTDSRIHYFDSIRPKLHSHYRLVYALKNHGQAFFEENTGL